MKFIADLYNWINKNPEDYFNATLIPGNKPKVLFIKPQLIAKDFYRYLMPYFTMRYCEAAATAITELGQFESKHNAEVKMPITESQILWADIIIFPFTTQPIKQVYEQIKEINPRAHTVFNIDFNFYELSQVHPLYKTFEPKKVKKDIEENMLHADTIMVSNSMFVEYLEKKIPEINTIGKKDFDIICVPYLLDFGLAHSNIDFSNNPATQKNGKLRIGIIATENNWEDINSFRKEFEEIHNRHKDKLQFVFIGFNCTDQATMKNPISQFNFEIILNKNSRPISIINYFKSLYDANLDAVFIPLRKTVFNETSDGYGRILEAASFKLPVIVPDVYPYNKIIKNKTNGFLFTKKEELLLLIDAFVAQPAALKQAGEKAHAYIDGKFGIKSGAGQILCSLFTTEKQPTHVN